MYNMSTLFIYYITDDPTIALEKPSLQHSPAFTPLFINTFKQQAQFIQTYIERDISETKAKLSRISLSTNDNNKVQISSQNSNINTIKAVYKLYGKLFGYIKVFAHNDLLSGNILLMLNRSDTAEASTTSADGGTGGALAMQTEQLSITQSIINNNNNNRNNTYQSLKKSSRKSIISQPPLPTDLTTTNPTNTLTHTNNINKQVILIDFEYASYNLRAWDIANHFCECAGFDANFEHDFPCILQRNRFYKAYIIATSTCILSYMTPSPTPSLTSSSSSAAAALSRLQCMFSSGNDDTDTEKAAAIWAERVYTVVNEIAGYIHTTGGEEGGEIGRERGSGEEMKGVDVESDSDKEAKLAAFLEGFDVSLCLVCVCVSVC